MLPKLPRVLLPTVFWCLGLLFFIIWPPSSFTASCTVITNTSCSISPSDPHSSINYDVTVVGQVNETGLELKGYSAPGSFIVVSDETSIIGTGTAAIDGTFDFFIHALQANSVHTISLQADNGTQRTPPTSFVVTVSGATTTIVSNILLPTFIDVTPLQTSEGSPITVSGTTVPGGLVTLYVQPPLQNIQVNADPIDGTWSTELIADFGVLPEGTYTTYAGVSYTGGLQSENSKIVQFQVTNAASATTAVINGYGPPAAFLTFAINGNTVVGTGSVLADGTFTNTLHFPNQNQDVDISILADNGSQVTPPTIVTAHLLANQTDTINDVLLTTFIEANPDSVSVGDPVVGSGTAANGATIVLTIEGPVQTTNVNVDINGNWSQELLSVFGTLPNGVYRIHGHVVKPGGLISVESRDAVFDVKEIETATDLVVSGVAAPQAFLTFTENNAVVGTAVVNPDGTFSQVLKFADINLTRTVSVVADNGVQVTPPTTFTASLTAFSTTTVDNLVLPTFIDVVPLKAPFGTTVQAIGTGVPNSTIRLFVANPLTSRDVTSDSAGRWSTDINSMYDTLEKGSYIAYARTITGLGGQSNLSRQVDFDVVQTDQCVERRSDLNCDGKVDIIDVGILIYYWGEAGAGQKADINKDGVVDIADVGIMVYDWTY